MRSDEISGLMKKRRLDALVVCGEANLKSLVGFSCDNGILVIGREPRVTTVFYTDFRYAPEARRKCRGLKIVDIRRFDIPSRGRSGCGSRIGFEGFVPYTRYLQFEKLAPKAKFVDVQKNLLAIRAVKTPDEITKLRAAEKLDCDIYEDAVKRFRPGMTERQMAAIIKTMMIELGEGEAFDTIVCVGKNAAECHHEPDDTVWNGREPVLVDMGVKLNGFCSDLTRNLVGTSGASCSSGARNASPSRTARPSSLYRKVYDLVLEANRAAIAAAKPGMTGRQLDKVARDVIRKGGFGRCFGHSLGHGVGYEIHEAPSASKKGEMVLKPGMLVTIEPGIYLEDNLGVRIEDLVLITETGCEVLSATAAK